MKRIFIISLIFLFVWCLIMILTKKLILSPKEKEGKEKENLVLIEGIGFQDGAWAKYKISNKGKNEEILSKMISFKTKDQNLLVIEKESEEISLALFLKEEDKIPQYLLVKRDDKVECFNELLGYLKEIFPYFFNEEFLEKAYQVKEIEKILGEREFTLESGKKIKVFQIEKGTPERKVQILLSGDVPGYLVFFQENSEISLVLSDFGLSGAVSKFTFEDLLECQKLP